MSDKIRVRVYTCKKHPTWTMEDSTPVMKSGLKVFCPLCRDELFEKMIGVAEHRVEMRERVKP
jgi:hypothetical protein